MKTIEEQARRYAMKHMGCRCPAELEINHPECRGCYLAARDDFKAGYKAATRWISVEEELPEVGVSVLIKTANRKCSVCQMYIPTDRWGTILGGKVWRGSGSFKCSITHWLPIPPMPEK